MPLAWLEIMQVVAATEGCRVLAAGVEGEYSHGQGRDGEGGEVDGALQAGQRRGQHVADVRATTAATPPPKGRWCRVAHGAVSCGADLAKTAQFVVTAADCVSSHQG